MHSIEKYLRTHFYALVGIFALGLLPMESRSEAVVVAPPAWKSGSGRAGDPAAAAQAGYDESSRQSGGSLVFVVGSCTKTSPLMATCPGVAKFVNGNFVSADYTANPEADCLGIVTYTDGLRYCGYNRSDNIDPRKNRGPSCPECGNPINPLTGNKYQREVDFDAGGSLAFVRSYNSSYVGATNSPVGRLWTHNYNRQLGFLTGASGALLEIHALRAEGQVTRFQLINGAWTTDPDLSDRLATSGLGWQLLAANGDVETYDAEGRLTSIRDRAGRVTNLIRADGTTTGSAGDFYEDTPAYQGALPVAVPRGFLLRVEDHRGRSIHFKYKMVTGADYGGNITAMIDPQGREYRYFYDTGGRLIKVRKPAAGSLDTVERKYHYGFNNGVTDETVHTDGNIFPYALTGITDEKGFRYATFKYKRSPTIMSSYGDYVAVSTAYAESDPAIALVNQFSITYPSAGVATVVDPLGATKTYGFAIVQGAARLTGLVQPCPDCTGGTASESKVPDANGNVVEQKDFNGNLICSAYDLATNLELSRAEGYTGIDCANKVATSVSRKVTREWHGVHRIPRRLAEPLRITTFVFHGDSGVSCAPAGASTALVCSKTIQATSDATGTLGFLATPEGLVREWLYSYDATGHILSVNGPRTDVADTTTYAYYDSNDVGGGWRAGDLQSVNNALGHVTQFTAYDGSGRLTRSIDANGLEAILDYWPRGWLKSRQMISGTLNETTQYAYDAVGNLIRVTQPDGSWLNFSYDGAHRLEGVDGGYADTLVNSIDYVLDAAGNRKEEKTFATGNDLKRKVKREFDALGRLWKDIANTPELSPGTTIFGYDANGNLTNIAPPTSLARAATTQGFDALNRLASITNSDTGVVGYEYDGIDQLKKVTDPRGLETTYALDGLGNQSSLVSPDTGTTTFTLYDAAGNLKTTTDARNKEVAYTYDVLNRVKSATYADQAITYTYDQGVNGKGRLTRIVDATGQTDYTYDPTGRVKSDARQIGAVTLTTLYGYDAHGRLSSTKYPSGTQVDLGYDDLGRVTSASAKATTDPSPIQLFGSAAYHPFGGVASFTFGASGPSHVRGQNLDGRVSTYSLGPTTYTLTYDDAGNVTKISDSVNLALDRTYSYDSVDRLLGFVTTPTALNEQFWYDLTGNREKRRVNGVDILNTIDATSNRLAVLDGVTRSYDNAGNFTSDGTLTYDDRGRLKQAVTAGGTFSYSMNAIGQRVKKSGPLGDRYFAYDSQGRLLGEYGPASLMVREYVWLGDLLVATLDVTAPIADYNVDRSPDMVLRNVDNGYAWAWLLNADSSTQSIEPFATVSTDWDLVGLADFNADGKRDAAWRNWVTGANYIWYFNGLQFVSASPLDQGAVGLEWKLAAMADFNNDGHTDLVWRHRTTGDTWVWYMNGANWASNGWLFTLAHPWTIVAAVDMNLDGHVDFILRDPGTGANVVRYMNGLTMVSDEPLFTDDAGWSIAHVADFNRDGRPDIVYKHAASGVAWVQFMEDRQLLSEKLLYSHDPVWQHQSVIEAHQKLASSDNVRPVSRPVPPDLKRPAPTRRVVASRPAIVTDRSTAPNRGAPARDVLSVIPPGPPTPGPKSNAKIGASRLAVHHVHTDHLGTPRLITRASDNTPVWRWDNVDPFGDNAPEENPSGLGVFAFNLRFPGQYYDAETGTHYNYFRDYDPEIGRYIESDPIGLWGGINTYGYVGGRPLSMSDPKGLVTPMPGPGVPPDACRYYDEQCKRQPCSNSDKYACSARKCCESFGNNPWSNCTRKCLIDFDSLICSGMSGSGRDACRKISHYICYSSCSNAFDAMGTGFGLRPPPKCVDASNSIGGMGF